MARFLAVSVRKTASAATVTWPSATISGREMELAAVNFVKPHRNGQRHAERVGLLYLIVRLAVIAGRSGPVRPVRTSGRRSSLHNHVEQPPERLA